MRDITAVDKLYEIECKIRFFSALFTAWDVEDLPLMDKDLSALSLLLDEVAMSLEAIKQSLKRD